MNNKLGEKFLVIQATIDKNSEKMKKQDSKIDKLTEIVKKVMDNIQTSNYSPEKMY